MFLQRNAAKLEKGHKCCWRYGRSALTSLTCTLFQMKELSFRLRRLLRHRAFFQGAKEQFDQMTMCKHNERTREEMTFYMSINHTTAYITSFIEKKKDTF